MKTQPNEGFSIEGIGQIAINVHNFAEAVDFYETILGLELQFRVEQPAMAFFNCNGVRLMVAVPTSAEYDTANSIIYYRVSDIQTAHQVLQERGVVFSENPHSVGQTATHDVWMAFLADPEGNTIGLVQDVPLQR